jgi:hypothetical protein
MAKIRTIMMPLKEGKHVTVAQARAAFRELKREGRLSEGKVPSRQKSAAKAG